MSTREKPAPLKNTFVLLILCMTGIQTFAQEQSATTSSYADMMLGISGSQKNISISYQYNWTQGKRQKFEVGVGVRLNSFFSSDRYFVTAPSRLVKGATGPGALFNDPIPANMDSLLIPTGSIYSLNAMISFGYLFSEKLKVGFNIDVIGVSFGSTQNGTYINGTTSQPITGSPSAFNLLLVGENDLGSLNSEFFVAYSINEKWQVKLGIQHIFMEYTTDMKVQQFPEPNDRFRITPTVLCFGAAYKLN